MRSACVLLLVATASLGCRAAGRSIAYDEVRPFDVEDGSVATLLDYLETGRRLAADWLEALPEDDSRALSAAVARAADASVRLAARRALGRWSYEQASGSGVLVDDGRGKVVVLTAAHTLDGEADSVLVTTSSGRRLGASLRSRGRPSGGSGPDWAVLDLEGETAGLLPAVESARARAGELVFLLAYPDQCGIDERGRVVRGDGFEKAPLGPLVTFARVASTAPLDLVPVAGAVPLGGASGGGVFDSAGRLLGTLTGVEWEAGRGAVAYRMNATAVPGG